MDANKTDKVSIVFDHPTDGTIKSLPSRGDLVELEITFRSVDAARDCNRRLVAAILTADPTNIRVPVCTLPPDYLEVHPQPATWRDRPPLL